MTLGLEAGCARVPQTSKPAVTTQRNVETNRDSIWLAAILVAGICLRIAALAGFGHAPESDELAYQSMALNLVAGNGILENGNRAFYNAGYPMFILAPVFYFFGENLL